MNKTCRKWKAFNFVVAAWQVGPTAFSLRERCRVSGEAAWREERKAAAAALLKAASLTGAAARAASSPERGGPAGLTGRTILWK